MKLEGSLDTFPLRELIDMAVYSSVTGAINIFSHGENGRLYFRDGALYHATRAAASGVDALAELFEHTGGSFAIVSDITVDEESLWGVLSHHLQTAERLALRWRMVRPYIPTLDLTPLLLLSREAALRRIGPAHHPILNAIDGQASLHQITARSGWAAIDVAEAIVQMAVDGLVDLRTAQNYTAPTPPREPPDAPNTNGGIFDRLRIRAPLAHPDHPEALLVATTGTPEDLILKLLRS